MRRRKVLSFAGTGVLMAAGMAVISVQSLSTAAFGSPAGPVGERVDAQIERATEKSVEEVVERTVERAEELAAERAVERAEEAAAGKLIEAMSAMASRAAKVEQSAEGGVKTATDGRGTQMHAFRLDRDANGHEIARGEGVILVDRPELSRLLQNGLRVLETRHMDGLDAILVRFAMPAEKSTRELLSGLSAAGGGFSADYNHIYRPGAATTRSGPREANAPSQFYDLPDTDSESRPKLGLIDSALYDEHEAFRGARIVRRDFVSNQGERSRAHGTAIASILVGQSPRYRGIMPQAELYSASVFFIDSSGAEAATTTGIVRALDWLVTEDVPVVNLSLTGPPNRVLERAVEQASARGVMIVAAVGNGGPAAPPAFPAAYQQVIGITAVDGSRAVYRLANRGLHVEFSAPGVDILCASHDGSYTSRSGTSMAAPFAAAILAQARSRRRIDADRLLQDLRRTAEDLGESGFDPVYGHGLIRQFTGA